MKHLAYLFILLKNRYILLTQYCLVETFKKRKEKKMPVTVEESKTPKKKNEKATIETKSEGLFDFSTILNTYGSNLTLDSNSDEYLAKLRKILEDPAYARISCKRLDEPGAFAFTTNEKNSKNAGIILIFMSAVTLNYNDIINRTKFIAAARDFKNKFPDYQLLHIMTVTENDYDKCMQMAAYISNTLQMKSGDSEIEKNLTISQLKKYRIVIDSDINNVKNFFKKHYPHKAIPRCDIGFIASIGNIKKNYNQFMGGMDSFDNLTPLFAVSGYTEFIEESIAPGTPIKFTPIIHVTGILSIIPSSKILSMAIPVAVELFISGGMWKAQYLNPVKGSINIGNLINDPKTNKPWVAKTQNEITGFFNTYMNPPFFAIDIAEGKARIPNIEKLMSDNIILDEMASFLEIDRSNFQNMNVGKIGFNEIIGEIEADDNIIDSREIDYLFLMSKVGYRDKFEAFKYRLVDPTKRAELISEIANFTKTGINYVFLIDSNIVRISATVIGQNLTFYNPGMNTIPTVSLSQSGFNYQSTIFDSNSKVMPSQFSGWDIYK